MRQHLIALALVLGGTAHADPKPKKLDLKKSLDKFNVYKDDVGKFYVVPMPARDMPKELENIVFHGDGKTFYKQSIISFSVDYHANQAEYEWLVWSPRVKEMGRARVVVNPKELSVTCNAKEKRPLVQLSTNDARKMVDKAAFYERFWMREARFLARDDDGTYYFVDRLDHDAGGGGYRVFVGKKGAMKQLPMTNLVSDSAGDIYATKAGELKFITEGTKAFWKKGGKKVELVVLKPADNRYLIYRELGIYGQLGTICEDQ